MTKNVKFIVKSKTKGNTYIELIFTSVWFYFKISKMSYKMFTLM